MQDEPRYSSWAVTTFMAWVVTAVLIMAAWMVWLVGHDPIIAVLVAETACVASSVAVVLQARCFGARLARLIRVSSGLQRPDDAQVRQLGPRD